MSTDTAKLDSSWIATATAIAKDLVSLLRDGALFLLAVLLVIFPAQFNSILVEAGFEEGSVVGFKWKSKLIESNRALEDAQLTISKLQGKNDELLKALSEANEVSNDPKSLKRLATLEDENKALKTATQNVQARVTETIESNVPLVEKALSSANRSAPDQRNKSDYTVGLQTLGIDDSERVALNEGLRSEGYGLDPITWSYPANQRPSWFADRSTVFYYSAVSRSMAEQVAQYMKSKTGQDFSVRRGGGLGVDPSRKELTLFVHYVKGG
jgi:hypothetical protein